MFKLKPIFQGQKNKAAAKAAFAGEFDKAFSYIEQGADINSSVYIGDPDDGGGEGNIGYAAIKQGNLAALEKALDKGLNPDFQSHYRAPLVVFAIMERQEEAAKLLIARGADVSEFRLTDFFSPLSLTRIYEMPAVGKLIEERLTPAQLESSRAADIPQAPAAAKKTGFNP